MTRIIAVSTVLLALVAPGLAQDSLNCRQVGIWPESPELDAEAWSIALDPERNLAFLGTFLYDSIWENWTFCILDISDLSQPRLLSANIVRDQGDSYDVHHNSNRLYLGTEGDGFTIWDVSDPTAPESLGVFDVPYAAFRLAVAGNYAYLATLGTDLRVIDVSDPRNPVEVGRHAVGYTYDVEVAGELVYLVDPGYGLWLVDVSDPTSPYTVGGCGVEGRYHLDVAVADGYAYLLDLDGYVNVIKVSNPEHPVLVATSEHIGGTCSGLAVSNGFLYVAANYSGLVVLDVNEPENPVRVGHYQVVSGNRSFFAERLAVEENVAFVADAFWGLRVIEFLGAGVEEPPSERPTFANHGPTVVRGVLMLSGLGTRSELPERNSVMSRAALLNASGRKVMELLPGENDVRHLAPGVYFIRAEGPRIQGVEGSSRKVVIQR